MPDSPVSPELGLMALGPGACREGGAVRGQAPSRSRRSPATVRRLWRPEWFYVCLFVLVNYVFFYAFHSEYII